MEQSLLHKMHRRLGCYDCKFADKEALGEEVCFTYNGRIEVDEEGRCKMREETPGRTWTHQALFLFHPSGRKGGHIMMIRKEMVKGKICPSTNPHQSGTVAWQENQMDSQKAGADNASSELLF